MKPKGMKFKKYSVGEKNRSDQQGDIEKEDKVSTANVLRHDFRHKVYLTISTH